MLRLKKAARPRTELKQHNNQDTRVRVESQDSKRERGKGDRIKRLREVVEAFVIRQFLLDIWENRLEYWERACDKAVQFLEVLTS
jgi:hypothetical protein